MIPTERHIRRGLARTLVALAALIALGAATTVSDIERPLPDPAREARAQELIHQIRCLVCQGESIAESQADLARDLRRLVREKVAAGESDEEIRAFLRARYGDWILLKPPLGARTWLLWFGPPALLLVIAGILLLRWRARRTAGPPQQAGAVDLVSWVMDDEGKGGEQRP